MISNLINNKKIVKDTAEVMTVFKQVSPNTPPSAIGQSNS